MADSGDNRAMANPRKNTPAKPGFWQKPESACPPDSHQNPDTGKWLTSSTRERKSRETGLSDGGAKQAFLDNAAILLFAKHGQAPKCFQEAEMLWNMRERWLSGDWPHL